MKIYWPGEPCPVILTPREAQVAHGIMSEKGNREIARELGIADKTVKGYVGRLYEALGVENRVQAAMVMRDVVEIVER